LKIFARGYFGQFSIMLGLRSGRRYAALDELPVRRATRAVMVLAYLVMMPLILPFGVAVEAYRALTRSADATRHPPV
jgi:hypothetical protein